MNTSLGKFAILDGEVVPTEKATLPVASSAVLYGLSVYTVFFGKHTKDGYLLYRLPEHAERLLDSAIIIGLDVAPESVTTDKLAGMAKQLIDANEASREKKDKFFRVTLHATNLIPGVKTRGLTVSTSLFMHDAVPILPPSGARIKTSLWRRVADSAIPARAKVNGAYVNSALAKQDALDSGFHDCVFLNQNGYVSELSAANVFLVRNNKLITPDNASDILEGITRRSVFEIADELGLEMVERKVSLTELYVADELFACGTSAFISPIIELDNRKIANGKPGDITTKLQEKLTERQTSPSSQFVTIV